MGVPGKVSQLLKGEKSGRVCRVKPVAEVGQETITFVPAAATDNSAVELTVTITEKIRVVVFWPPLAVPPSSCTVTVIMAVPVRPAPELNFKLPLLLGLT